MKRSPARVNYQFIDKPEQVYKACAVLSFLDPLGFDIETNGLDPFTSKILTLQLGNQELQYIFHVGPLGDSIKPVFDILTNSKIVKIGHNLKFDYKFVKHHFGVNLENIRDTYVIDHLLTKGQGNDFAKRYSLDKCVANYLDGFVMDKSERNWFIGKKQTDIIPEEQIRYAAMDVAVLCPLWDVLKELVIDYDLQDTAALECSCVMATGDLELNGIKLDRVEWAKLEKRARDEIIPIDKELQEGFAPYVIEQERNKVQTTLFDDFIGSVNLDSPLQVKPILEKIVGITLDDTEEKTIEKYKDIPLISKFLIHRGLNKKITTYGSSFFEHIHEYDQKCHPEYDQIRPETGRYSSKNFNAQNIPTANNPEDPDYKKCFIPDDGYSFICSDYSGCELRILAELSGEESWIDGFIKGLDMHCLVAARINNMKYEDMITDMNVYPHKVKKELKGFRNKAKVLNFGEKLPNKNALNCRKALIC